MMLQKSNVQALLIRYLLFDIEKLFFIFSSVTFVVYGGHAQRFFGAMTLIRRRVLSPT